MIIELLSFDGWKDETGLGRENMELVPITINTDYIGFLKRQMIFTTEMCEVGMVDWRTTFIVDKTYEEMCAMLQEARILAKPPQLVQAIDVKPVVAAALAFADPHLGTEALIGTLMRALRGMANPVTLRAEIEIQRRKS